MSVKQRPFVVEFKNRRRQSTQQHSIWGALDLKAASDHVASNEMPSAVDAGAADQKSVTVPDLD